MNKFSFEINPFACILSSSIDKKPLPKNQLAAHSLNVLKTEESSNWHNMATTSQLHAYIHRSVLIAFSLNLE